MPPNQVISLLERAVEELNHELREIEAKLSIEGKTAKPTAPPERALKDQHADLVNMLQDQRASLMRMLNETLAEMEKLKRTSSM